MALFAKLMAAWFNMDEQKENAAMACLKELYRAFDEIDTRSDGAAMDRKGIIDAMLELFLTSQEYDALRKVAELDDTFANRQTVKQARKFAKMVIDGIYIMDDQKVKSAIAGLEELRTAYDEFDNMPDCEAMVREGELDAMEEQFFVSHNDAPPQTMRIRSKFSSNSRSASSVRVASAKSSLICMIATLTIRVLRRWKSSRRNILLQTRSSSFLRSMATLKNPRLWASQSQSQSQSQ